MIWNYRIIQFEEHLALHEVFYDEAGKVEAYTADAISFVADIEEGAAGIIGSLEQAFADASSRPILQVGDLPVVGNTAE